MLNETLTMPVTFSFILSHCCHAPIKKIDFFFPFFKKNAAILVVPVGPHLQELQKTTTIWRNAVRLPTSTVQNNDHDFLVQTISLTWEEDY